MSPFLLPTSLCLSSLLAVLPAPLADSAAPSSTPSSSAAVETFEASGTFEQTGITGMEVSSAGPVTLIEQTSVGEVSGTMEGGFEDELNVVILPGGVFVANFVLTVACSVDGQEGTLTLQATDVGEIVGPDVAEFTGVAAIVDSSGGLAGMHGQLNIEGTVDLTTGLSTYTYAGSLHAAD